jgi:hypothetical protein
VPHQERRTDEPDDTDHLTEVHEILERLETGDMIGYPTQDRTRRRYDLCESCYQRYLKNPLAREGHLTIGFSSN